MDLANPTLVYIIVCLDRAASAAGMRLERIKMYESSFQSKARKEEEDKEFDEIKEGVDSILKDVIITSSKAAIQVNDAVSNMPLALQSVQFNEAVNAGFEQVKYATEKLVEADGKLEALLALTRG